MIDDFNTQRVPFYFVNQDYMINAMPGYTGTCKEFVSSVGADDLMWASAIRGYISRGRVQFYTGADYRAVEVKRLTKKVVEKALQAHFAIYPLETPRVFNGVKMGDPGKFWEPIMEVTY